MELENNFECNFECNNKWINLQSIFQKAKSLIANALKYNHFNKR